MHTGAFTTLEFDRVVDAVTSFALTPLGAEKLAQLRPLTDAHSVQTALAHTTEGVRFLAANGGFPLEAPDDLDTILASLAIEAQPLEPAELALPLVAKIVRAGAWWWIGLCAGGGAWLGPRLGLGLDRDQPILRGSRQKPWGQRQAL